MLRKKIFIVLFLISIMTPYIVYTFAAPFLDTENNENRVLAEMPSFSLSKIESFPRSFERYINDHLPFRNQLIRGNSIIDISVFHTSPNDDVILGKDGWLFFSYVSETGGDSVSDYMGRRVMTEEELEQIVENVNVTKANLEAEGRQLVILILPNKNRVYPEYMPDYYGEPSESYPVRQIVEYLAEHTNATVIYPYEELMRIKNWPEMDAPLYYKTDTHWNYVGAYVGATELLRPVGVELPAIDSGAITWEKIATYTDSRDLADELGIGTYLDPSGEYKVTGYTENNWEETEPESMEYFSQSDDQRTVVVRRDSFGIAIAPFIASQFAHTKLIHHNSFSDEDVRDLDADIFILEMVERHAPARLLEYRYERGVTEIPVDDYVRVKNKDGFKWSIERVTNVNEVNATAERPYVAISGWFAEKGVDSADVELTVVLRDTETETFYEIPTTMSPRKDVSRYMNREMGDELNYANAGFTARFPRNRLDIDGAKYKIYIRYARPDETPQLIYLDSALKDIG